jgi:hypothetical protein
VREVHNSDILKKNTTSNFDESQSEQEDSNVIENVENRIQQAKKEEFTGI